MRFRHRALAMGRELGIGLCIALCLTAPAAAETYVSLVGRMAAQNVFQADLEGEIFNLANQFRMSHGLRMLARDEGLHAAARAHAADMLAHDFLGHTASTGQDFDSRMRALYGGAMVLPSLGENAARLKSKHIDRRTVAKVLFESWVKSPDHRHTLLSRDYVKVATGFAMNGNAAYADQIFLGPEVKTNMVRQRDKPAAAGLY